MSYEFNKEKFEISVSNIIDAAIIDKEWEVFKIFTKISNINFIIT